MPDNWQVAQGITAAWTVTVNDADGVPVPYAGTEALAGSVRAGRDLASLFAPTLAWVAPVAPAITTSTLTATIAGTDTASLDPGRYLVQVKLADGSADLYEGFLEVAYSPGSAAVLPTYGSFADMLDVAPNIEKFQKDTDLAGFARQRNEAREWFDDLLQRHYRNGSGISTDFAFVPGISFGGAYGPGMIWRDGRRSKDLRDWLDADRLDVTKPVRKAVTYYAVALVLDRQSVTVKEGADFAATARKFFARAENGAADITAEIDSDGDGVNDTTIRLGSSDTLEG